MSTNLPDQIEERSNMNLLGAYVVDMVLLLLYGGITMWLLFSIRDNLVNLSLALRVNPWVLRAIDRFGIFLLGLSWLAAFILIENYFRVGVQKRTLLRRAGKTFAVIALLCLASEALNWLL